MCNMAASIKKFKEKGRGPWPVAAVERRAWRRGYKERHTAGGVFEFSSAPGWCVVSALYVECRYRRKCIFFYTTYRSKSRYARMCALLPTYFFFCFCRMGFGPTYVAHIPPLEGWYSRDSLCYEVGARVAYITAKAKKSKKAKAAIYTTRAPTP